MVVEAALALCEKGFDISDEAILDGIAGARFPARIEVLSRRPLVVLDGAHNPDGARALAATPVSYTHLVIMNITLPAAIVKGFAGVELSGVLLLTFVSVSYTHLDVYKRQSASSLGWIRALTGRR